MYLCMVNPPPSSPDYAVVMVLLFLVISFFVFWVFVTRNAIYVSGYYVPNLRW